MIIVSGFVDVDPAQRGAALEAAGPLLEPTREQRGCRAYVWCADPTQEGRIWVYECWEDEPALAAHLAGHWYQDMLKAISSHGMKGFDVAKHDVSRSGPVYDGKGRPRADFFTDT